MEQKKECKCGGDCKCKKIKEIQDSIPVESCGERCACKNNKELDGTKQPEDVKHITEFNENFAAQLLIQAHSIAGMRDETDFDNVQYHIAQTLDFAKDIIINIEGTNQEKADFIERIKIDLEKFNIKK